MVQQFITTLIQLYCNGDIEDIMLLKRECPNVSIKHLDCPEQFFWYITNCGYNELAVKSAYKLRYDKIIQLDEIRNIKFNRFSIKIDYLPRFTGTTYWQRPSYTLKLT